MKLQHTSYYCSAAVLAISGVNYFQLQHTISMIMQGSPDKKLPRCVTRFLPSFLQD